MKTHIELDGLGKWKCAARESVRAGETVSIMGANLRFDSVAIEELARELECDLKFSGPPDQATFTPGKLFR
jgi:hypothetical protein